MKSVSNDLRAANTAHLTWASLESEAACAELARFVREGGVVVFPTESSYALGADPASAAGVAAVFDIKGRSADKPLPVVAANREALEPLGIDTRGAAIDALLRAWPGALTVILPSREALPAACGRRELAVRVPGHRRLLELLSKLECSLTATSANLAGGEPVLDPASVADLVGARPVRVIDEGRLPGGPPSTLVRLEGDCVTVLRRGAMPVETLRALAPSLCFVDGFSSAAVEISVDGKA